MVGMPIVEDALWLEIPRSNYQLLPSCVSEGYDEPLAVPTSWGLTAFRIPSSGETFPTLVGVPQPLFSLDHALIMKASSLPTQL
jgi:hypothetical protein